MRARLSARTQLQNTRRLKARMGRGYFIEHARPAGELYSVRVRWALEVIRLYRHNIEYNMRLPYPNERVYCNSRPSKAGTDDSSEAQQRRIARRPHRRVREVR